MARRSQRLSTGNASAVKHKRSASGPVVSGPIAKRPKSQNASPAQSQYFPPNDGLERRQSQHDNEDSPSSFDESGSDFGANEESALSEQAKTESEDDDDTSDSIDASAAQSHNHAWRPGVRTGLGPGKQLIIKKPKPRSAGKTPYTDHTIHPNTLLFLADLKANNDRQWLKMHDAEFRRAEKDWHGFVESTTEKLMEIDETIPELPLKDIIFRIYRDIRFSKDPTPYKPWFSVAWSRAGRKSPAYAHYYIQIAPNKSFVGGGLWHPESSPTAAMRQAIDRDSNRLKGVLVDDRIRKEFLGSCGRSEAAAVKAFVKCNRENALKTKPKGYGADHQDIELLRLRNYTIGRSLTDEEVLGEAGLLRVAELLTSLKPFITYLNSVISPDGEDADDDESSGDEEHPDDTEHDEDADDSA
ncbi:hypothetical protein DOTSEDRAFT_49502 [Dothistroma septosporum NZE10]|uniref:DUF2461 domain-containing protein n=1 Tax=Dothistroma septosporum (strain NZE10 / CBS 128990) TaxID=675120 RepID=N1Q3G4_DOTSN|nr:hypothetical protein DOTSEDRAFT_49502 [Dothistroma septosporum NZE10]